MTAKPHPPAAALSRSASQARTRDALLDAAEALILEQSIPALSLRAVCAQAGYTQGAFYSNFNDREELLLAVMERNLEQKAASLERMLEDGSDSDLEGVLDGIVAWLGTIAHRTQWARLAIELRLHAVRDAAFAKKLDAAQARVDRRFGAHIAAVIKRFDLSPVLPPDRIALTMLVLWRGLALQMPEGRARKRQLGTTFALCLRGLLGIKP